MRALIVTMPMYRLMGARTEWAGVGPLLLATILREDGIDAKVLNGDYDKVAPLPYPALMSSGPEFRRRLRDPLDRVFRDIATNVRHFDPDWLGFYVNDGTLIQAEILMDLLPEYSVTIGGPATVGPIPGFPRAVVRGAAEGVITSVVKDGLPGYIEGAPRNQLPKRLPVLDPEALLFPPESDNEFNQISASRGCPFPCTFCDARMLWGGQVPLPLDYVKDEVRQRKTMGIGTVQFIDDAFTLRKDRAKNLSEFCSEMDVKFFIDSRCDALHDIDMVKMLHDSGCVQVKLGVEGGTDNILKSFNKKQTMKDVRKAVDNCQQVGLPYSVYVLLGHVGGSEPEYRESVDNLLKLDSSWYSCGTTYPYRHTTLWQQVNSGGHHGQKFPTHLLDGGASVYDKELREWWGISESTWELASHMNDGKQWIRS